VAIVKRAQQRLYFIRVLKKEMRGNHCNGSLTAERVIGFNLPSIGYYIHPAM